MKLYSRRQVILTACIIGAVALAAGGLIARFVLFPQNAQAAASMARQAGMPAIPVQPVQLTATVKPGVLTDDEQNSIAIYEKVNKAVVYITSVTVEYNWFMEAMPQEGTGSGVIMDQGGHVLTNRHVVTGAAQLTVTLADGTEVEAKVIGEDPQNDLAVLKFDPKGKSLTTIPFGNSSGLRVGQKVLAIGNPFGFDRTLTTGIVSGLERPLQTDEGYVIRQTIQTDAAINPGNSGGPLLNSQGELIGINTAIYSPSGTSSGVGFAIPINTVKRIVDDLLVYGMVKRGWIDVDYVQISSALARAFKLPVQKGILVSASAGNASTAGIRGGDQSKAVRYGRSIIYGGGDIIIEVNGQKVETASDFMGALEDTKPGEIITVKILRGTQEKNVSVKLVEEPRGQ